jgi:hypothetical protein
MTKNIQVLLFCMVVSGLTSGCRLFQKQTLPGALRIVSEPSAKVYLNGIERGTTPFYDEQLEPNGYLIRLTSDQGEWSGKVKVISRVETVVDRGLASEPSAESGRIVTLEPGQGLAVITEPNRAVVILDDQEVGQTPWIDDQLAPGEHVLIVRLPGYRENITQIKTRSDYRLTINVELATEVASTPLPSPEQSPSPSTEPIFGPEPSGPSVVVQETGTSFGLRVRSGPGLSYSIVTNVLPGETFPLLEERSGWIKIRLPDGSEGWVSSRYVTQIPS